jgi:hypothetical protein
MASNIAPGAAVSMNIASSVTRDTVSAFLSQWSGRGIEFFRNIPIQVQQSNTKAIALIIAANALFLIIMKFTVLPFLERRIEEKSDDSTKERFTKRVVKVLIVGTLLTSLNLGFAKLARYPLNTIGLFTVLVSTLAVYHTIIARRQTAPAPRPSETHVPSTAPLEDGTPRLEGESSASEDELIELGDKELELEDEKPGLEDESTRLVGEVPKDQTLPELVAKYGGKASKAIRNLRALGKVTMDQIVNQKEIRQNLIEIVKATVSDKNERKGLVNQLRKINSDNILAVLNSLSNALGKESAAFQFPAETTFTQLGLNEKKKIFVRQRVINEAEETYTIINICLSESKKDSQNLIMTQISDVVARAQNSENYEEFKTDASLNLLLALSREILPGPPGDQTRGAIQRELKLDITNRGIELPNAMETIGAALLSKGHELGNSLITASYNL